MASSEDKLVYLKQISKHYSADNPIQRFREYFLTLSRGGKLLGHICVQKRKWQGEDLCIIYDLFIHPAIRKQGFGTTMLSMVEQLVTKEGYSHVVLHVYNDNVKAISLYNKLGYYEVELNKLSEAYQDTFKNDPRLPLFKFMKKWL